MEERQKPAALFADDAGNLRPEVARILAEKSKPENKGQGTGLGWLLLGAALYLLGSLFLSQGKGDE